MTTQLLNASDDLISSRLRIGEVDTVHNTVVASSLVIIEPNDCAIDYC
jgi:hypothetical protein